MKAVRTAVFLVLYLTVSEAQVTPETESWLLHPSWDVLEDVLSAIGKAVDYCSSEAQNLNLDGIIGLRAVDDQFSLFLERYGPSLVKGSTREKDLLATLNGQRWKARNASEAAGSYDQLNQVEYYSRLGSILRKGQWAFDYPLRTLDAANRTWPQLYIPFVWNNSDSCLHEILGTNGEESPSCKMTENCWTTMTFPDFSGYAVTHQLLYLEMGERAGCGSLMSKFSSVHDQGNVSLIQNYLCTRILSDAMTIQENGFPEKYQDLFLEQIFLCGMLGYQEFLTEDWLSVAISLQDETGCYALRQSEGNKVKREERKLAGDCGSHKTSVALGALTTYARFLLKAIMEN